MPAMQGLANEHDVLMVAIDQCMYGLTTDDGQGGQKPANKQTAFMTNSTMVAEELMTRCDHSHEHGSLIGADRAAKAVAYPDKLCRAICRGLRKQKESDEREKMRTIQLNLCEGTNQGHNVAYDDISGASLRPDKVKAARHD
eukprot:NODE_22546_length_704_cov_1.798960.p1 GENE.NODE_22546_length_704_cov_1.798960~~NODE_22546_length_704_cov_1.798960.p1  ORF type:complete len:142 (+),score=12.10 NODE_22546_length_704_cov_1.798960:246-671(+)